MSRLKRDKVEVMGEKFLIRQWTPAERSAAFKARESDVLLFSSSVAYACTINEDGSKFFKSEKAVREEEPTELADELCAKIMTLSGVSLTDEEPGKE